MANLQVCPHCGSHVVPTVQAGGQPICPACGNTGIVRPAQWAPAPAAPLAPAYAQPAPNADGAVLALVMGILALAIPYIGFIFAFIGLGAGKRALQAIAASAGRLGGAGMAKAGRIMAIVSLCLYGAILLVVLAAVLFVMVSNLGTAPGNGTDVALPGPR